MECSKIIKLPGFVFFCGIEMKGAQFIFQKMMLKLIIIFISVIQSKGQLDLSLDVLRTSHLSILGTSWDWQGVGPCHKI